jgi:hypothetical protein
MALSKLGKTWYDAYQVDNVIENNEETVSSRYSTKTNLLLNDGKTVIRNLRASDIDVPVSDDDTVYKITPGEEFRPDIVAYREYKDPTLYWVLLSANNMKSIFEFVANKIIRIPEITKLYMDGGVLGKSL